MTTDMAQTNQPTKQQLLDHYAEREPQAFIQFDSSHWPGSDGPHHTWELIDPADMRILVRPEDTGSASRPILRVLIDWVERQPGMVIADQPAKHQPAKSQLLDRYAEHEPQAFNQLDVQVDDFDGQPGFSKSHAWELVEPADVRILIRPGVNREWLLRVLHWLTDYPPRQQPTKQQLLDHYAEHDPQAFIQLDGFDRPGDSYSDPDTGLGLFRGYTWELIDGADVRILIRPRVGRQRVLEMLYALTGWVERQPGLVIPDDDALGRDWQPRDGTLRPVAEYEIIKPKPSGNPEYLTVMGLEVSVPVSPAPDSQEG
jgi:hypothetical protein